MPASFILQTIDDILPGYVESVVTVDDAEVLLCHD